jgi:GNAT superfamily N-acetyltransferase
MYCKWFSTPEPDYAKLVSELYGSEVGGALYRSYVEQLSSRDLWGHRLDWSGVGIYNHGAITAHAVVQTTKDKPLVYIGFVECVDDRAVAAFLIKTIQHELRSQHPHKPVYIPVNLSIWHNYRFKVRGTDWLPFESPTKPYYAGLFSGFLPRKELYSSYRLKIPRFLVGAIARTRIRPAAHPQYKIRNLSPDNPLRDMGIIYDLSVQVFESDHSVPSFEEFRAIYQDVARSADPRYILFAEEEGEPVGFITSVKQANKVYVKTLAVLPSHQGRGVGRLLYETLRAGALDDGCDTLYGLTMRNDRLITRLVPPGATKAAEYVLYKDG